MGADQPKFSRRRFVGGAAGAAGLAGAAALGWSAGKDEEKAGADGLPAPVRLPFRGTHQTGITSHAPAAAIPVASIRPGASIRASPLSRSKGA